MKIAISTYGQTLDSKVDPRFGRAAYFIIFDSMNDSLKVVENKKNLEAAQGAGIQSAKTIVDQQVSLLITGHVGPKAFSALKASDVKILIGVTCETAEEAIELYKKGNLKELDNADVDGHWV